MNKTVLAKKLSSEKIFVLSTLTLLFFLKVDLFNTLPHSFFIFSIETFFLFCVILCTIFSLVRHAENIAYRLKEPFGSLFLTFSIALVEIIVIVSLIVTGEDISYLARDTMLSVLMITMNGIVGFSLLFGALRNGEQVINLQGSRSFLSIIFFISVLGLILPNFTESTMNATLSPFLSVVLSIFSLLIYAVFLDVQIARHRYYFFELYKKDQRKKRKEIKTVPKYSSPPIIFNLVFFLLYMALFIGLCEFVEVRLEKIVDVYDLPRAINGILVAILILAPEGGSAIHAALENEVQRSINIALGSACASMCLTVPAVLLLGVFSNKEIILGLDPVGVIILLLTFFIASLTFGNKQTNLLLGAIHIFLFFVFIFLNFDFVL